ncbi:hypothetical protein R3I94_018450 [Phoxinus phoxinus]
MLAGDYMLAINILLSGNNYRKISLLFDFMKLGMVDRSSFYRIQDAYCVDTVEEFWTEKRNEVIAQVQSKGPVVVLGDARMDSPGFSAQYCTYTAMDNSSTGTYKDSGIRHTLDMWPSRWPKKFNQQDNKEAVKSS